jgi:flagella basal body P-ring formation protein FlgA
MINRRTLIVLTLLPLLMALTGGAAERTTVRLVFSDSAMVNDTVIRLSDIASINGPEKTRDILASLAVGEAAPAGYDRFVNTSDLIQYQLAPKFPLVNFLADNKRVLVRTDGVEYTLASFKSQIIDYLQEKVRGTVGTYSFEILNPDRSWKNLPGTVDVKICGEMKNAGIGNFNVNLVLKQGTKTTVVTALCHSSLTCPAVVAMTSIARGESLSPSNCQIVERKITSAAFIPYTSMDQIASTRARRTISAGSMISSQFAEKIPAVNKGDAINVTARQGAVAITLTGVARQSGGIGDRIWVENTLSRKLVQATVSGQGKAEIRSQGAAL